MAVVPFKYYLHDDYNSYERADFIASQTGIKIDDELAEKIDRPFYEVTLNCTLDTETGEVKLISASL